MVDGSEESGNPRKKQVLSRAVEVSELSERRNRYRGIMVVPRFTLANLRKRECRTRPEKRRSLEKTSFLLERRVQRDGIN